MDFLNCWLGWIIEVISLLGLSNKKTESNLNSSQWALAILPCSQGASASTMKLVHFRLVQVYQPLRGTYLGQMDPSWTTDWLVY